jgi:hypothetical protein
MINLVPKFRELRQRLARVRTHYHGQQLVDLLPISADGATVRLTA